MSKTNVFREISVDVSVAGFFPKNLNISNTRLRSVCLRYIQSVVEQLHESVLEDLIAFLALALGSLVCVLAIRNAIVYKQNLQHFPSVSFFVIFCWRAW